MSYLYIYIYICVWFIYLYILCIYIYIYIWLVVSTPLKYISQLGWLFPIYGRIKNVPNHQPDIYCIYIYTIRLRNISQSHPNIWGRQLRAGCNSQSPPGACGRSSGESSHGPFEANRTDCQMPRVLCIKRAVDRKVERYSDKYIDNLI